MISMTYEQVDQALASHEGLLNLRIVIENEQVKLQKFQDDVWIDFDAQPLNLKRYIVRDAYKMLKLIGSFDPECEFIMKKKFETSVGKKYIKSYNEKVKERNRENRLKNGSNSVLNDHISVEEQKYYIDQMKDAIVAMTLAHEGDGFLKGFSNAGDTKRVTFHDRVIYMSLCDDGISGPLFVSDDNEYIKIDNDPEELSVLMQLLEHNWIKMPEGVNE